MKNNNIAMNNQLNCWNSPIKSSTYSTQSNETNNQIQSQQHNSSRNSFSSTISSDLSTNQLANLSIINLPSDYSFNSSSSSTNSNNTPNNLIINNNANVQLINQITMVNAITSRNQITQSNEQVYSIDTTKASNNQTTKNQLPRCFNDLSTSGLDKNKITKKKGKQSAYKHVPHREKPKHLVEKRNARERNRVQKVNQAFSKLRKTIPIENKNKRVSKVKTLKKAIEYIAELTDLLKGPNSSASFTFKNIKLDGLEIPSSTTKSVDDYEFKLEDDDDSESNETFFNSDYFDETSQQSTTTQTKLSEEQINYQSNQIQYQTTSQSNELTPSDTNNNIVAINNQISNQINNQINNQIDNQINNHNLPINIFNDNQINYQNNRNQLPNNQLNKENILYQNFTTNCNTIYNTSYTVYQTN